MTEAQNCIDILQKRGMSIKSIGAAIGASREAVSRMKSGKLSGKRTAEKLKRLVNVHPSQLSTVAVVAPSRPDVAPIQQRIYEPPTKPTRRKPVRKSQPGVSSLGLLIKGIFMPPTPQPQPKLNRPYQEYNELPSMARRPRR